MYVSIFFTEKTAVSHWWYEFLVQLHKKLKFEILKIKVIGSKTLWEILVLPKQLFQLESLQMLISLACFYMYIYIIDK